MLRQLSLLLVLCGGFVGCQAAPSIAKRSATGESIPTEKVGVDFDFNVNSTIEPKPTTDTLRSTFAMPEEIRREIDGMERQRLREEIIASPRGSQVGVYDESGGRYCGTVLRAGPDRIEMMNCLSQEVIPGPDGQQQCKKSHIPLLTIETSAVTHFAMIAPPPPNFPKTDEEIDPSDYTVAEIVNRSGQRLSWGKAPEG
jgi:hypothetical protein